MHGIGKADDSTLGKLERTCGKLGISKPGRLIHQNLLPQSIKHELLPSVRRITVNDSTRINLPAWLDLIVVNDRLGAQQSDHNTNLSTRPHDETHVGIHCFSAACLRRIREVRSAARPGGPGVDRLDIAPSPRRPPFPRLPPETSTSRSSIACSTWVPRRG